MARNFDGVGDQIEITLGSHAFTPEDWTIACFIKLNSFVNFASVFLNGDAVTGGGRSGFLLQHTNTTKFLINVKTGSDNPSNAVGTTTIVNGTQYHIAGTKSGTALEFYQDGVNEGSDTTPEAAMDYTADAPETTIGNSNEDIETDGHIAEVAVWDVALNIDEIKALSKGFSPSLIRPASLLSYWPLIGRTSPEPDIVGGQNGTVTGAVASEHPPVIYRTQPSLGFLAPIGDLDTEDKRRSGIAPNTHVLMPLPDGTIVAVDRQQAAWIYSGIAAAGGPANVLISQYRQKFRGVMSRVWGRVN